MHSYHLINVEYLVSNISILFSLMKKGMHTYVNRTSSFMLKQRAMRFGCFKTTFIYWFHTQVTFYKEHTEDSTFIIVLILIYIKCRKSHCNESIFSRIICGFQFTVHKKIKISTHSQSFSLSNKSHLWGLLLNICIIFTCC